MLNAPPDRRRKGSTKAPQNPDGNENVPPTLLGIRGGGMVQRLVLHVTPRQNMLGLPYEQTSETFSALCLKNHGV
jgi:hypothetical protein